MKSYDMIVIGFGKAGKTLAAKLAKQGKHVALVEKSAEMYGGTCINVGCIPSKRLITDAQNAPKGDFEAQRAYYRRTIEEKRALTAALRRANYEKLLQAGVEVVDGIASFTDSHHIEVQSASGCFTLSAEKFLINTGSVPVIPEIIGVRESGKVFLSETIMALSELPERLSIVGGGYIGLEFASMYADFGSRVTILQDGDLFLPREDRDIAESIQAVLEAKGIRILRGVGIHRIEGGTLHYSIGGAEASLEGDAILLATGRRPNTEALHAERAGVQLSLRGAVETDAHLRTTAEHIWAAGDVCGKLQFTYISLDDSRIVLSALLGEGGRTTENRGAFSYSVFLTPPFSRVGLNEAEAAKRGLSYRVVSMPAASIPKTKVLRRTEGMLKALIDPEGYILGAELFCAESHELINMVKLAIDQRMKYTVLRDFIFTHPTMSESLNDLFAL